MSIDDTDIVVNTHKNLNSLYLGNENASTTNSLDLFFSRAREETGLDDAGDLGKITLTEDLTETGLQGINDGNRTILASLTGFFRSQRPELVQIDDGTVGSLLGDVEVTHTNLSKVTGMVSVQVGAVMVKTTGHTATSGMLTMLSNTTVTS